MTRNVEIKSNQKKKKVQELKSDVNLFPFYNFKFCWSILVQKVISFLSTFLNNNNFKVWTIASYVYKPDISMLSKKKKKGRY